MYRMDNATTFYEVIDRDVTYTPWTQADKHSAYKPLIKFVDEFHLENKKCLEIGSSKGLFQDLVKDYTGIDVSKKLGKYYHKKYVILDDTYLFPFDNESFDAIWSWAVHEHIPDLQSSLEEIVRVLKKGGILFFAPAWNCRSWAAQGYPVRSYLDLTLYGKIIKFSILFRDSTVYKILTKILVRLLRFIIYRLTNKYKKIKYRKLNANYEKFRMSDSDACNSIDPYDLFYGFAPEDLNVLIIPKRYMHYQ